MSTGLTHPTDHDRQIDGVVELKRFGNGLLFSLIRLFDASLTESLFLQRRRKDEELTTPRLTVTSTTYVPRCRGAARRQFCKSRAEEARTRYKEE